MKKKNSLENDKTPDLVPLSIEVANRVSPILSGWPKHSLLRYRSGPTRSHKIEAALIQSDITIISLDRDLFATISELMNITFSIFQ